MFNRCKHHWKITDKRYVPSTVTEITGDINHPDIKRLVYGYTEISMICDNCGAPTLDMIVGRWSSGE